MPRKPKKTRRARGTGSVLPDARRGGYLWKIPVGRYASGRTKYTEVRGRTLAEVLAKGKLVAPPDPAAVTVGEWAARWVRGLSNRSSTKAAYAHSVTSRVAPALGHVKLKELTVSQVKAAAQSWVGAKKDGKLAPQTVNVTLDRAATMFAAAVTDGLAASNPFALCPRLEYERKPIDPFTPAELKQVIAARDLYSCAPVFAFLAATGCRVGEAVALDVGDYDAATGRIGITKTYNPDHGEGPPKSKHSRRVLALALSPPARTVVSEAVGARKAGVLFATSRGRRFHYQQLRTTFAALLKRLNLRPRGLHNLRHGVATALLAAPPVPADERVQLGDIARWLGDSVATVVRFYLHPSGADVGAALGDILR